MFAKMSQDTKLFLNLFLPFYVIHCAAHIYLIYGSLLQRYGFSPQAIGWILGIYFLGMMVVRPLGGWLLENFGIRRVLAWSAMSCFAGCSLLFLSQSETLLFIGRAISGASVGVYTTGLLSYQALCIPQKSRGTMLSLLMVGGALPMATVTPLGEWLLLNSFDTFYLAIGPILSILCCFLGWRVGAAETEQTSSSGSKPWGTYSELFSSRPFLFLILTGSLLAFTDAIIINISLLAAEKGLMASYFLTSSAAVAVTVRVAGSPLLNVLPRVVLLAPCAILMACATILISLFPTNAVFVIGGIIFGIGIGAGWPMFLALIADLLDPALLPKGTSTALLFFNGGFSMAPLIVGYFVPLLGVARTFITVSLAVGAALILLEVFYWLPFYWKSRSPRA